MVIDFLISYTPDWLGPCLFILGLFFIMHDTFKSYSEKSSRYIWAVTGFFLVFLSVYFRNQNALTIVFISVGGFITGLASLRIYQKVIYIIFTANLPPSRLKTKIKRYSISILLIIIIYQFLVFLDHYGYISISYDGLLKVIWTFGTGLWAIVGFWNKTTASRKVSEDDNIWLSGTLFLGVSLCIAGSTITNLPHIYDLTNFLSRSVSYTVGYSIGAVLWYVAVSGNHNQRVMKDVVEQLN